MYTSRGGVVRGTEGKMSMSEPMETPHRWRGGRRNAGEERIIIAKDNTSYQLLWLAAFIESPEKQVMGKDLLSSSPNCFQHGDRRQQLPLCPQAGPTLCIPWVCDRDAEGGLGGGRWEMPGCEITSRNTKARWIGMGC